MQNNKTNWIWTPSWNVDNICDTEVPVLVIFRKELELLEEPKKAQIRISADSRYKLYIDGVMVEMGPSRGDRQVWFYDEINLLPYLKKGKHVLAVQVLRYPTKHLKGNFGIFRTEMPGLFAEGCIVDVYGNSYSLCADESWKCRKSNGFHIVSEADGFAPLQIYEDCQGEEALKGWMLSGYDDSDWSAAKPYPYVNKAASPGNLIPRTIPFLYRKDRCFKEVVVVRKSATDINVWEKLLECDKPLVVAPHTKEIVEITAGEEMTAYLHLAMQDGKDALVTILQSESYVQDGWHNEFPIKGRRDDWQSGHLNGFTDRYKVGGFGTEKLPEEYEPFWFRTFRFIRLEIETEDEPLILSRFYYTETGYPLEVKTNVSVSDENLVPIWEISERTLRRCMHETYEDCPFYEQLQYAMDARSEILYTYAVSADDRLARKCMDDFKRSQRYDGLLNCSYPCYGPNVIPGFSIYYILMLYDHMMYFGDKGLLKEHMPIIEGILGFFDRNLVKEGYVDKLGGLNGKDARWSFIDWTPEWDETTGVPAATLEGAITMESLLYIMGLQNAAKIAKYLGRHEQAKQYLLDAANVQCAVKKYCSGTDGMLQDGPGVEQYSQHVQVFAVLTDTVKPELGKINLEKTLLYPKKYAQCSVAMAFYLFRAMQKTDMYILTQEYWKIWTRMIEKGATTCIEDEVGERSDCHAWGSLILYELPSVVLGVRPAKPGYRAVCISPEPGYMTHACGSVVTPVGTIKVKWDVKQKDMLLYEIPEGIELHVDTIALEKAASYY